MYKKEIKEIIREATQQGWRVERGGKHYRAYPPSMESPPQTIPITPSDYRGYKNLLAQLRRGGMDISRL